MIAAKKKPPEPSLAERIQAFQVELDAFLDAKAAELKATREGRDLFIGGLKHMITRGDTCRCRIVARLLGDPDA